MLDSGSNNVNQGKSEGATRAKKSPYGTQGEVGISLKIFLGRLIFICHHTNTSCGDNLLSMHHNSLFFYGSTMGKANCF